MSRLILLLLLIGTLSACDSDVDTPHVDLSTARLGPAQVEPWPQPAIESGHHTITVRQVFTARGPCRELAADLLRGSAGEFMLRVVAHEAQPCPDVTPHLGYTAVLSGLPAGRHHLRVVHVGADGSTLAETVFEHPIIVTAGSERP